MIHSLISAALSAAFAISAHGLPPGDLDGASGRIFDVDLEARTFELLKETEYDPVAAAVREAIARRGR